MIYTVECSYSDTGTEDEWNAFYSREKLRALISVEGFLTSQRFRLLRGGDATPTYLAIQGISAADILGSQDYRRNGGGNFGRWQPMITRWRRNIYEGIACFPSIEEGEYVLTSEHHDGPLKRLGLTVWHLRAVGLDRTPAERWIAVARTLREFPENPQRDGMCIYAPMGEQLQSPRA